MVQLFIKYFAHLTRETTTEQSVLQARARMENGGRSKMVFITTTVTFVLASIFAAGRIVSRFYIVKRHGWDDYTYILAWVSALAAHC